MIADSIIAHPYRTATLLLVLVVAGALWAFGMTVEGAQAVTRYTARLALVWFVGVFSIGAWARLARGGMARTALRSRRHLGLAFAYVHTVHLAAIVTFVQLSQQTPPLSTVVVGGLGYVFLYLMVATSNAPAVRTLGPSRWRRLHTFGMYYLWFVFFITNASRLPSGTGAALVFATASMSLLLGALAVRLYARRPQPARAGAVGVGAAD